MNKSETQLKNDFWDDNKLQMGINVDIFRNWMNTSAIPNQCKKKGGNLS